MICGQGPAPRAATIAAYRERGLDLVPGTGPLAACVPGAFDAWMLLLRDFGTMTPREVLRYAIGYARDGFPALPADRRARSPRVEPASRASGPRRPSCGCRRPSPARGCATPLLAETYGRLVAAAEAAGHDREAQIDARAPRVARGLRGRRRSLDADHAGLLTGDDLAAYRATIEEPVSLGFRGWTVFKTGPWGQGPVLLQQLALLDGFELDAMSSGASTSTR